MKNKAVTLIEILVVIAIISASYSLIIPKLSFINELDFITNRILIYLKYVRFISYMDDRRSLNEKWYKQRWTLKFQNCKGSNGIYFLIYSDKNMKGHANRNETMQDPLTDRYLYATNSCKIDSKKDSDTVLLTYKYNIVDVSLSCNNTSSIGQISFGHDGTIYNRLTDNTTKSIIKKPCILKLTHKNGKSKEIIVEHNTGYAYINK